MPVCAHTDAHMFEHTHSRSITFPAGELRLVPSVTHSLTPLLLFVDLVSPTLPLLVALPLLLHLAVSLEPTWVLKGGSVASEGKGQKVLNMKCPCFLRLYFHHRGAC